MSDKQWPRPDDFKRMSQKEFDAYIQRTGFDTRITAARVKPMNDRPGLDALREAIAALPTRSANGSWCGGYRGLEQPPFPDPRRPGHLRNRDEWHDVLDRDAVLAALATSPSTETSGEVYYEDRDPHLGPATWPDQRTGDALGRGEPDPLPQSPCPNCGDRSCDFSCPD